MDPITIGLAAGGIFQLSTALMSYLNSRAAAKASAKERQRLYELAMAAQEPDFDMSTITPQEFSVLEKYVPATIPFIAEQAPEVVEKSTLAKEAQGKQLDAMRYMSSLAKSGVDPIAEMDRLRAARLAAQEAGTSQANIRAGMERRGVGMDSGLSLGLQQQAAGQAGLRTAMAGEEAARDALARRNQAMGQAATLGGQVYGQELDLEAQNVGLINAFNQRMAQRRQAIAQANVDAANQASRYNIGTAQEIADKNVAQRNAARQADQDRRNSLAQRAYENRMAKQRLAAGLGESAIAARQGVREKESDAYAGLGQGLSSIAVGAGREYQREEDERKRREEEERYY
jgi:hypothetical protein